MPRSKNESIFPNRSRQFKTNLSFQRFASSVCGWSDHYGACVEKLSSRGQYEYGTVFLLHRYRWTAPNTSKVAPRPCNTWDLGSNISSLLRNVHVGLMVAPVGGAVSSVGPSRVWSNPVSKLQTRIVSLLSHPLTIFS